MSIHTKLFEIQKQNLLLTADADNPFFKSKYISIENIMSTLKPLLEKYKILLYHYVNNDTVITCLRDTESELEHEGTVKSYFPLNHSLDAQKKGAEITYGKRYNLVSLFCIVEDDDDGNFASGKTAPQSVQIPKEGTFAAKYPYKATYTPKNENTGTSDEKPDWVNEKEVDKLFDDMIDGKIPLASGPTKIIMDYRNNKKRAVSKKVAGYIEEQYVARVDNISFPGTSSTPLTTKDGIEIPF